MKSNNKTIKCSSCGEKMCIVCGKKIIKNRFRKYCSDKCRMKKNNEKNREYQLKWSREKRGRYYPGKIKCEICGKYYNQVGSHIYLTHKMTAREYREQYGFNLKRGQLADWLRDIKAKHVFDNGTVKNLKIGKKYWFIKGDKKAGRYKRQEQTIEMLRNLYKTTNRYKKLCLNQSKKQ